MIAVWAALSRQRRRLLVEAAAELLRARLQLLPLPGLDWQRALGARSVGTAAVVADRPPDGSAGDVGWAVSVAARVVPWRSVCLPQAIAAQRMLRRRGIPGRAVVGARRSASEKPIDLHVWVLVDGRPIVGGSGHGSYEPVVAYDV